MKNFIPLIFAAFLCLVLIAGYGFVYTRVAAGILRTETALARSGTLTTRDALARSQQVFLENSTDERAKLGAFIARDADVVSVIELIEKTASEQGASVAISTINTTNGDGWVYHEGVEVNFSASGTFEELTRFMGALETLPIASTLKSASLEVSAKSEWFGTFSVLFVKEKK